MTKFPAKDRNLRLLEVGQSMWDTPPLPSPLTKRLATALGLPYHDIHHGGFGWQSLLATAEYRAELEAAAAEDFIDIVVMNGGTSDWLFDMLDAEECYAAWAAYKAAYVAACPTGKRYFFVGVTNPAVGTAFYFPIFGVPTAAQLVIHGELNDLLVADEEGLFDATALCHTAPFADPTSTTYFNADQLHLKHAGEVVMCDRLATAVLTLPPFQ